VITIDRKDKVITCFDMEANWSDVDRLVEAGDPDASAMRATYNASVIGSKLVPYLLSRLDDGSEYSLRLEVTKKPKNFKSEMVGFACALYVYYKLHEQTPQSEFRPSNTEDYYRVGRRPAWREYVSYTVSRFFERSMPRKVWSLQMQKAVIEK
jgi:hypothetical protein